MAQRITIDSATLFNKAMELIEAKEFFGVAPSPRRPVAPSQIEVVAIVSLCVVSLLVLTLIPDWSGLVMRRGLPRA